jgi:hypothetical protein
VTGGPPARGGDGMRIIPHIGHILTLSILTRHSANAALRVLRCVHKFVGAYMSDIVEKVLSSYGRDVSGSERGKVSNYIALLASTGKTDEQLVAFGTAYLKEILEPDPRYSGC